MGPEEGRPPLVYKWYQRETGTILEETPDIGTAPVDALNIKLVPGVMAAGGWQRLDSDEAVDFAKGFLRNLEGGALSLDEKKQSIKRIHSRISTKSITCQQCHNQSAPLIPYTAIGYAPEKAAHITSSELVSMIERFGVFNYPVLFQGGNR